MQSPVHLRWGCAVIVVARIHSTFSMIFGTIFDIVLFALISRLAKVGPFFWMGFSRPFVSDFNCAIQYVFCLRKVYNPFQKMHFVFNGILVKTGRIVSWPPGMLHVLLAHFPWSMKNMVVSYLPARQTFTKKAALAYIPYKWIASVWPLFVQQQPHIPCCFE